LSLPAATEKYEQLVKIVFIIQSKQIKINALVSSSSSPFINTFITAFDCFLFPRTARRIAMVTATVRKVARVWRR
jgi:hypothetical protein